MDRYLFESDQFAISTDNISFLRSRFPYKTISLADIRRVELKNGSAINNSSIIIAIGLLLVFGGLIMLYNMIIGSIQNGGYGREIKLLIVPIFMLLGGGIAIYSALKRGIVVKFTFNDGSKIFRIKPIEFDGLQQVMKTEDIKKRLRCPIENSVQ